MYDENVNGLPSGAPLCVIKPRHANNLPQTSDPEVCAGKQIEPNGDIRISVSTEKPFKGIRILTSAAGSFHVSGDLRILECTGEKHSLGPQFKAVTHRNPKQKSNVEAVFRKAQNSQAEPEFDVIIVRHYATFWTGIKVGNEECGKEPTTLPPAPTTSPPAPTTFPPAPTTFPPAPTTSPPAPTTKKRCLIHGQCRSGQICSNNNVCEHMFCRDHRSCGLRSLLPAATRCGHHNGRRTCEPKECFRHRDCRVNSHSVSRIVYRCHHDRQCKPVFGDCQTNWDCVRKYNMRSGDAFCRARKCFCRRRRSQWTWRFWNRRRDFFAICTRRASPHGRPNGGQTSGLFPWLKQIVTG